MNSLGDRTRPLVYLVVLCFFGMTAVAPAASAALISTDAVLGERAAQERGRLLALLDREDVRAKLQARGVDPHDAQARVAALTDEEVQVLANRFDELPAGGDALGVIVLVFLVLLFTDIMGFTDVFPFVKKRAR
jgi:hypothetical protein